jgi:hypothetical protein
MNDSLHQRDDILNIMLCNRIHSGLSVKSRAIKLAKTCKKVRDRTGDSKLKELCKNLIERVSVCGRYKDAVECAHRLELLK